jgi:hypothetical protein
LIDKGAGEITQKVINRYVLFFISNKDLVFEQPETVRMWSGLLFGFYKSVFEFQKIVGLLTWVNLMAFHF